MSSYGGLIDRRVPPNRVVHINRYLPYMEVTLRVGRIVGVHNPISRLWYEGLRAIEEEDLPVLEQVPARARLVNEILDTGLVPDRMRDELVRAFR